MVSLWRVKFTSVRTISYHGVEKYETPCYHCNFYAVNVYPSSEEMLRISLVYTAYQTSIFLIEKKKTWTFRYKR